MIGRLATTLALAVLVLGCGPSANDGERGEPVQLLTGTPPGMGDGGCFASNHVPGLLVVDPRFGTALLMDDVTGGTNPVTVMWRPGFTAQRVGDEVEVRNADGAVVAITGRRYDIAGGYVGSYPPTFWACAT